jgi:hypothetical protein
VHAVARPQRRDWAVMSTRFGNPRRVVWSRGLGLVDEAVVIGLCLEFAPSEQCQIIEKNRMHVGSPRESRDVMRQRWARGLSTQVVRIRRSGPVQVTCQEAATSFASRNLPRSRRRRAS